MLSRTQRSERPAACVTPIRYQAWGTAWLKVWTRGTGPEVSTWGVAAWASTTPLVPIETSARPGRTTPLPTAPQALSAPPPATGIPSTRPVNWATSAVMVPQTLCGHNRRQQRGVKADGIQYLARPLAAFYIKQAGASGI